VLEKLKKTAFICGLILAGIIIGVILSGAYSGKNVRDLRDRLTTVTVDRDSLRRDQRRATESARSVYREVRELAGGVASATLRAERAEKEGGELREIIVGSGGSIAESGKLSEEARGILRRVYESGGK